MKAKKNKRERSPQMQAVSAGLQDVLGMTQWRKEHPKATFREIDQSYEKVLGQIVRMIDQPEKWLIRPRGQDHA